MRIASILYDLTRSGLQRFRATCSPLQRLAVKRAALISLGLLVGGCSHEAVYGDLQRNQRLKCVETTGTQTEYEKCIEPTEQTYRDYVREREETMVRETGESMGDESSGQ